MCLYLDSFSRYVSLSRLGEECLSTFANQAISPLSRTNFVDQPSCGRWAPCWNVSEERLVGGQGKGCFEYMDLGKSQEEKWARETLQGGVEGRCNSLPSALVGLGIVHDAVGMGWAKAIWRLWHHKTKYFTFLLNPGQLLLTASGRGIFDGLICYKTGIVLFSFNSGFWNLS